MSSGEEEVVPKRRPPAELKQDPEDAWFKPAFAPSVRGDEGGKKYHGWGHGKALGGDEVKAIMKKDKQAREDYRSIQEAKQFIFKRDTVDPVTTVPPRVRGFSDSAQGIDPIALHKAVAREEEAERIKRRKKKQQYEALLRGEDPEANEKTEKEKEKDKEQAGDDPQKIEDEITRLEKEVADKKAEAVEMLQDVNEAEGKLRYSRKRLKDLEAQAADRKRRYQEALYKKGQVQGKLRSSDQYFEFLYQDQIIEHEKQMTALARSKSLMEGFLNTTKNEIREMLKNAQTEGSANSVSDKPK